ncbi:MAG: o-succinylbenzoate synthase [bacterium]
MRFAAHYKEFTLKFKKPMGTSRGILCDRDIFVVALQHDDVMGIGECSPLSGLSIDDRPDFQEKLQETCVRINDGVDPIDLDLRAWPSMKFGLESARMDLAQGGRRVLFETDFVRGTSAIAINGLIAMSDFDDMYAQIRKKVEAGFGCIKIKIGSLDFDRECELLAKVRSKIPADRIELRLDANGAFSAESALEKLNRLAEFSIHSIEQPIKPGQGQKMARLCAASPIPIALDEELIGQNDPFIMRELLETIKPHFIILKPSLLGGLESARQWIKIARTMDIGFWVTSALESNIGLNIISQWTASLNLKMPQGLGTGQRRISKTVGRL